MTGLFHHPFFSRLYLLIIYKGNVSQTSGCFSYTFTDRRIQLTQHRKNIQTDLITHIFILQIGTVCNISLMQTTQVIQNIQPAHLQQRPYNAAIMRTNTFQAIDSRATYQVQQKSFHTIVPMMGYGNNSHPPLLTQLFEPSIAHFASCHLNRDMMLRGISGRIKMSDMQNHSQPLTQLIDKPFIPVGFLTTKMKITMGSLTMIA